MKQVTGKVNAIDLFHQASIVASLLVVAFVFGFALGASPLQAQTTYKGVALTQADITGDQICTAPATFIQQDAPTCYNLFCSSGGASGLGACSVPQPMIPQDYYAAIASPSWANGALCGACAALKGPNGATTVVIVDECTTCGDDEHLDLGATAYSQLMSNGGTSCATTLAGGSCSTGTGGGQGVNITCTAPSGPITWEIIQCPLSGAVAVNFNNAAGDVSYEYKSSSSGGWDPVNFFDSLYPITAVAIGTSSSGPFTNINRDTSDSIPTFWGGTGQTNDGGTVYYQITANGKSVTTSGIAAAGVVQPTSNYGSTGVQFAACVTGPTDTPTKTNTPGSPTNTPTFTDTPTNTPTVGPPPGCPSYIYNGTAPHALGNLSEGGTNNETLTQTNGSAYPGNTNGLNLAINVPSATFYALAQLNWANYGAPGTNIPSTDTLELTINNQTAADSPMTFTVSLSDYGGPGAVVGAQGVSQSAPVTEVITGTGWKVLNIPMSSFTTGGTGYSLTDLGEFDWELLTTTAAETGTVYIGSVAFYGACPPTSTFTNTPTNTATVTSTNTATKTATVTSTSTATNSATSTATYTVTNTATLTPAVTNTFTNTPTNTPSSTATNSSTSTATHTATNTATNSTTSTATHTVTNTATNTPAITNTFTNTATNTLTSTPTNTGTPTSAITSTFTNTATNTSTHTATNTGTPTSAITSTFTNTVTNTATGTPTNTGTPTPAVTSTFTSTATNTPTHTATNTGTPTPAITSTFTNTFTNTSTNSATKTSTNTATQTSTLTVTNTATNTPTITTTQTATNTATNTITGTVPPTDTATITFTNTASSTPTNTATSTSSSTATNTPTNTSSSTATNSSTSTRTNTATSTATNTSTVTSTNTPTTSSTSTGTNTATSSATKTATVTSTNTMTSTPSATSTNTLTTTPTNTFTLTNTATLTPTYTMTNTATVTSTLTKTSTPTNTFTSTVTPTFTPTYTPTLLPDVLIYPPYPNPSTGSPITFNFQVPSESTVTMDVFTLAFRKISSQTVQAYGASTLQWDLRDVSGIQVANGLYYVRFHVSGLQTTTKILKVLILR